MHEARHHQQQQQQQLYSQHHGQLPMASSSAAQQHLQQQQQHAHQLRPAHHQPPPLTHGLTPSGGGGSSRHNSNNSTTLQGSGGTLGRGASPPHGSAPPHLPISGSSVSYSDDNGSFNMLSLPFDDSSSHLDLPSLLQANGNRDSRYNVGDHHHAYSAHAPLQPQQQHHRHTPQAASAWSHPEPLPPVRLGTESKPQEPLQPSPEPSPDQQRDTGPPPPQQITPPTKKRNADTFAQQQQQQQHQGQFTIDDAPKPTRTKKKKTVEKASVPLDDSDVLDDEFGDECDGADGVPKDVKRQMRLVKNRQAAQQFRKRQKQYIQDLERRCSNLTAQNAAFGAKVELLTTENRLVKEQLEYLRSFVSQAVQVSLTPAAVSGGPLQMPGPLSAALAGAIPAPLLGIGSPLAGALSSSLPSQTGPGRPAFAALQPTGSSAGSTKMPSFPSPISLAPSSAQQQQQQHQHLQQQQQQQRLPYLSASSGHHHQPLHAMSSAGYSRGGPSSLMPELAPRPL